jgi:transcriptional regulator with XRE-family HTH domain
MKPLEVFRSKVLQALEKLEWSQADLAKKTNIAQPSINVYLSGKKDPNVTTCERIASALGVPFDELFRSGQSTNPKPPHTLQDCVEAVNSALSGKPIKIEFSPVEQAYSDPIINEINTLMASLDQTIRLGCLQEILGHVQSVVRGAERVRAAAAISNKKKA